MSALIQGDQTRDPIVGKCLGLFHGRIAYPWTIADIAKEVGISRSAPIDRFTLSISTAHDLSHALEASVSRAVA